MPGEHKRESEPDHSCRLMFAFSVMTTSTTIMSIAGPKIMTEFGITPKWEVYSAFILGYFLF